MEWDDVEDKMVAKAIEWAIEEGIKDYGWEEEDQKKRVLRCVCTALDKIFGKGSRKELLNELGLF